MTISVCWLRKFEGGDEIVFASDSRLSAGYRWDCAQKIFPIPGPNFCISFAGETDFAFPCIFQFQMLVKNYKKFADGAASISEITSNFVSLCNQMLGLVDDRKIAQFNKTQFIVAGYDFQTGKSYQKIIMFNSKTKDYQRYKFRGLRVGTMKEPLGIIGDERPAYMKTLIDTLPDGARTFDYEPLEALEKILKGQNKSSSIGGFPQVVKVYRHRNYLPYATKRSVNGEYVASLFGRPLLDYQRTFYPIIDLGCIGRRGFIEYPMASSESAARIASSA